MIVAIASNVLIEDYILLSFCDCVYATTFNAWLNSIVSMCRVPNVGTRTIMPSDYISSMCMGKAHTTTAT